MADVGSNDLEHHFGEEGNDFIQGTHKAGKQYIYGGDDHDRMIGGDGLTMDGVIIGNGGDDRIYGGNNAAGG